MRIGGKKISKAQFERIVERVAHALERRQALLRVESKRITIWEHIVKIMLCGHATAKRGWAKEIRKRMEEIGNIYLSGGKRLKYDDYFNELYDNYRTGESVLRSIAKEVCKKYKSRYPGDEWAESAADELEEIMDKMSEMLVRMEYDAEKLLNKYLNAEQT